MFVLMLLVYNHGLNRLFCLVVMFSFVECCLLRPLLQTGLNYLSSVILWEKQVKEMFTIYMLLGDC